MVDLFRPPSLFLFFRYLIGHILFFLIAASSVIIIVLGGYSLKIFLNNTIPIIIDIIVGFVISVILMIKFQFYKYLIIDRGYGPIDALKKSAEIIKGSVFGLFIFGVMLSFINFLGLLFLIVGLLITIPATILADIFVYRKLLSFAESILIVESSSILKIKSP
ncbi:MAG: hypothetical protein KatS3mg096_056 [Candidatus Parcubacteria bacterium]|nr:MAG: hypothetical protein KatS3mg096_056 [Candidatus Parcubacteria bacterium]